MLVKDIIKQLQTNYQPDEELIVAYWDKPLVESFANVVLTKEGWEEVIELLDSQEFPSGDPINDAVYSVLDKNPHLEVKND
jgi:hypothetical protein